MKSITFPVPEGMVPPDGVTEGSTFEALATLQLGAGTLTLTAIDGLPVGEAPEKEEAAEPMEEAGFDDAMMAALAQEE
jgi:hypothetical protein